MKTLKPGPGHRTPGEPGFDRSGGERLDFMHRLRELDHDVEQLRAALAALQQHLAATRPASPPARPPARRDEEHLRAYA